MKRIILLALTLLVLKVLLAQAPLGFSYQAVIRNADGQPLAEQEVSLRITLQHQSGTPTHYIETHKETTSPQGVVNLSIGQGTSVSGDFANIPWDEASINIKVELAIGDDTNFTEFGITNLQSVPYALFALNGVEGPQGEEGIGIASISHNADGTLTINLTNDTSYTTDDLTGPVGPLTEGTEGQTLRHGSEEWEATDAIFIDDDGMVGVGTTSPSQKLEVAGNILANQFIVPRPEGYDDLLFAIRNSNDEVVFAVYESGVRIYVDDAKESNGKSTRSGFAIGGLTEVGKEEGPYLLQVNRDGTTVRFDETSSKSTRSGFAIGGLTEVGKEIGDSPDFMQVTREGTTIRFDDENSKSTRSGFAIGGLTEVGTGKAIENEYLAVTRGNTTVRFDENVAKSTRSGFAIGGLTDIGKEIPDSYMSISPENYLIGQEAGKSLTDGQFNSFMGYRAGESTTTGSRNIFIGYEAGLNNLGELINPNQGNSNVFIGNESGRANTTGYRNVFIGDKTGYTNSQGDNNIAIGTNAGYDLTNGIHNTLIGSNAGRKHTDQSYNIMIGTSAGYNIISTGWGGSFNTFIGINAGYKIKTSKENTFIGTNAGYMLEAGNSNTIVGIDAGRGGGDDPFNYYGYTTERNTMLGCQAGTNLKNGSNNVLIGYQAGSTLVGTVDNPVNNKLYIANSSGTPLIYGDFSLGRLGFGTITPGYKLDVVGDINISSGSNYKINGVNLSASNVGAEPTLTKGNLTATGPISVSQTRQVIGGDATISIADASESTKGAVQLSNSYQGNNESLATTEKALSDGLATKANGEGFSMEKFFIENGTIVQISIGGGYYELIWDSSVSEILISNKTSNDISYWWQVQLTGTPEGNCGVVDPDNSITIEVNDSATGGYQIHFGDALDGLSYCSVWLQHNKGKLVGHFTKF